MTTFKYKGITKDGATINGIVRAYDEFEAVTRVRETCEVVTKIEKILEKEDVLAKKQKIKIKDKDLAIMCSQFAIILTAGMPIVRAVEMVAEQTEDKIISERLRKVAEDISGGHTLAESFEEHMPGMPTTFIETVRAGEASGALEKCFKKLHKYYDDNAKVKGKISGALIYPAIVVTVAIAVFIVIMTVAVPVFTEVFMELGADLPGITKAMIAVSDFFLNSWWVLILVIAGLAAVFMIFRKSENGKRALAKFAIHNSPLKKIRVMNCASSFASTMSTMIASGLPIVRALEITSSVVQNYIFSIGVHNVKEEVEQGNGIAESMQKQGCFPNMLTEMTGVGERTGSMEATLDVIGEYYANEVQVHTQKLLAAMEPVMTIGLAVMTVVLLLGIYLPMFSLYETM